MNPLPQPELWWRIYRGPLILMLGILLAPLFACGSYSYLLPLAQLCGIYTIIVTGLTLLMGYTGQISMGGGGGGGGHAGFYGFGAYAAAIFTLQLHLPFWLAAPLAILAGGILAFLTGFMLLRLHGHHLALATLCLGVIITELISKSKITGGAAGLYDLPEFTLFGLTQGRAIGKYYLIWTAAWLVLLWAVNLTTSPVGRALKAIHGDEEAAKALGIPVFSIKLKVFVLSGMLAALAGVLYAFVYTPSYLGPEEFSLMFSITLITMVVLGGMGNIWGGLAGAITLTCLHECITLAGEKMGFTQMVRFEQLFFGTLLAVMLIYCPKGLAPAIQRLGIGVWGHVSGIIKRNLQRNP